MAAIVNNNHPATVASAGWLTGRSSPVWDIGTNIDIIAF